MSNPKGTQGRVSPNRKYQQLHLDDVRRLMMVCQMGYVAIPEECRTAQDARNLNALQEMIDKAERDTGTNARICLAHAVVRVSK